MKLKISLLALLCPIFWASGQQINKNQYTALAPGDTVPGISVTVVSGNNPEDRRMNIPDDQIQLLLVDFWSTTCGTCIKSLPELSLLRQQFAGKLTIILATYEKKERVLNFFRNRPDTAGKELPVAYADTLLKKLFVHQFIPHIAWIYRDKFISATDAEHVNQQTVTAVLEGQGLEGTQKKYIVNFNYNQPLFTLAANPRLGSAKPLWSSVFSAYLPGLPLKAGRTDDTINRTRRFYLINHPVLHLYALALSSPLPLIANRRILPADGDYVYDKTNGYYHDWATRHCYCYELSYPDTVPQACATRQLKDDLDRFLGMKGFLAGKRVHCLVLRHGPIAKMINERYPAAGNIRPVSTDDLVYQLNRQPGLPPVIDESGGGRLMLPKLTQLSLDLNGWRALLAAANMVLHDEERVLPMFVLRTNK